MSDLKNLFPEKKIPIADGRDITVRPIPVSKINDVIEVITPLLNPDNKFMEAKDAAALVAKHIVNILPLGLDVPLDQIPFSALPDIVDSFMEFNFPVEAIKKWLALGVRVKGIRDSLRGKPKA